MGERVYSIDAMRIIAVAFVILIHTDSFQGLGASGNMLNFGVKTTARFAVPFFFVTAGYFFALKTERRNPTNYVSKRVGKLASLYVFGLVLTTPTQLAGDLILAVLRGQAVSATATDNFVAFLDPVDLLYYGTSVSEILWFLPALLFSFLLVYLFVVVGKPGYVLPVALVLHVVGLLGTNYTLFVDVPFEVRDALFFGFFYTSLGYVIRSRDWVPTEGDSRHLLGLTGCFVVLQLVEFYALGYPMQGEPFGSYVYAPSYGVSTVFLTLSLFLFLLSRPTLGVNTPLPSWGKYAVGIYVTHPAVFAIFRGVRDALESAGYAVDSTLLWHLVFTPATLFGALAVYLLAHRLRVIEIGGSHLPGKPWFETLCSRCGVDGRSLR